MIRRIGGNFAGRLEAAATSSANTLTNSVRQDVTCELDKLHLFYPCRSSSAFGRGVMSAAWAAAGHLTGDALKYFAAAWNSSSAKLFIRGAAGVAIYSPGRILKH
ncbi:MAG: hypothetical protein WDN46_22525 [Methylocella sp.]